MTPRISGDRRSKVAALFIESLPSGAEVYLGSIKAGATPYQNLRLKAGQKIRVTLKHPEHFDHTIELTLSGGTNEVGPIRLRSRYGSLTVESDPAGADVRIAGVGVGRTPYTDSRILAGTYLISVSKPLHFPVENRMVEIAAGRETRKRYSLRPNFGTLEVRTKPSGSQVRIYNEKGETVHSEVSPFAIRLIPERYRLEIGREGYESLEFNATIARGKTERISAAQATLRRLEGFLIVSSAPYRKGAEVLVDGEKVGTVPANLTLPAGTRRVEVVGETKSGSREVTIRDGESTSLTVDIYDRFSRREMIDRHDSWQWKWISRATVGFLAGMYAYSEYQQAGDAKASQENAIVDGESDAETKAHREKALEYNDEVRSHNANSQTWGVVSLVCLGWAWWIRSDEPKNPEAVRWLTSPTPDGGVRLAYSVKF